MPPLVVRRWWAGCPGARRCWTRSTRCRPARTTLLSRQGPPARPWPRRRASWHGQRAAERAPMCPRAAAAHLPLTASRCARAAGDGGAMRLHKRGWHVRDVRRGGRQQQGGDSSGERRQDGPGGSGDAGLGQVSVVPLARPPACARAARLPRPPAHPPAQAWNARAGFRPPAGPPSRRRSAASAQQRRSPQRRRRGPPQRRACWTRCWGRYQGRRTVARRAASPPSGGRLRSTDASSLGSVLVKWQSAP